MGFRDVCRVWNRELPETEPTTSFSEDVLRECAEANAQGADWRLVYVQGLSLRQQYEIRGKNRKRQPCFDPDWTWWLEKEEDIWVTQPVEPDYRLYNFSKSYNNLIWQDQAGEVAKLGDAFDRAEEQAVAEICFSSYLLNDGERLLSNWYHWGHLQTSDGGRVYVGGFDRRGFYVHYYWDDCSHDCLGVVLARKVA